MADGSRQQVEPRKVSESGRPVLLWTYVLLTFAVLLFAAATAYGFLKMRQESDLAQYNSQAALWLVVSFEREYHILDSLLWRYAFGDPTLKSDDLLTQYDVLWSRIDLMEQGGQSRPLRHVESFDSAVTVAMQLVQKHEEAVFGAVQDGLPLPRSFVDEFRAMADPIHQFMIDTHLNRGWIADVRETQIRDTRLAIYLTLGGTLISTLTLFAIVIAQLKSRHGNLVSTMTALEQSERDRNALRDEVRRRKTVERERKLLMLDLEARNEELERYAYTISHDLKSPLYTIQGFTGFLEKDLAQGDNAKMRKDLNQIRDAVTTMSKLLDDILNLSRVNLSDEAAQQLSLADIVDDAIKLVAREIGEHNVEVRVQPNLPVVYSSPQRLTEVFQNLISNAAKFRGDQQTPIVEIGATLEGEWVLCYVRDNGIGIAPEYRDRVFNLFERLDNSAPGTGIGLAIVKRIIERLGGEIWVKSDGIGTGSRFEFSLPARDPA
ncbi:MAG: HAMP domain-containing histidine kinase [Gammaproteobacteria bacterium]|nr:HAMP domain-containing histidine kinase [Gammaproteobacteria bacterium]